MIISDVAGGEHSESCAGIRDNPAPLRRKDPLLLPYRTLIPLLRQGGGSDADPEGFSTKEEKFYSLKELSGFSNFNFINFCFAILQKKKTKIKACAPVNHYFIHLPVHKGFLVTFSRSESLNLSFSPY